METGMLRKLRILTICLILSGALNIGLFVCTVLPNKEEPPSYLAGPLAEKMSSEDSSMSPFLLQMTKRSFHELVSYLTNHDPVGHGYLKRDMAVAALVAFHHFNLEKALGDSHLQRRMVAFGGGPKIELFPGLSEEQFDAIIRFAYEEKWPLTAEGIFKLLKKWPSPRETTLVQAFLITPEFCALQALFQRVDHYKETAPLIDLVCEGNWETLRRFAQEQSELLDLSIEKRRSLLISYLGQKSETAARLLLQLDFAFVAKRMEDPMLLDLLSLCQHKTADAERLCRELLKSPRTDEVWALAAKLLYLYAGEDVPSPFELKTAIGRFGIKSVQTPAPLPAPVVKTQRYHTVKEGENLWKIARQYNVKVDELIRVNAIEKERLYPGMTLKVP